MTPRLVLLLLALLPIAACTAQEAPAPAATTAAAIPATSTAPAAISAATTAATTSTAAAAEAAAATTAAEAATVAAAGAAAQGPAPIAGTDYMVIEGGQPFDPGSGRIEVVEAFGYTCPHCAELQPLVNAWKAKLPGDVRFTYVPAPFGGYWIPYARAYYAAEAMGVLGKSHDAMFRALHLERSLPIQNATADEIGDFYAKYGVDPKQFASTMRSFAVDGKINRAKQFLQRTGVDGTPMMLVNGKYRVATQGGFEKMLATVNKLIAQERAAKGGAPRE
ncbi:MAG: thiol:disulfide interchange protein DsbA/DsbL [Gammaproteobacteria bacterium]|nr:thiol:disulfide interchange protein DsbA/DsbL [Gammaproteobacteria bacterium]